jgi:hypothetical protein
VECWGHLFNGDTSTNTRVTVPTTQYKQISSGGEYSCGIKVSDSSIECWGILGSGYLDYRAITGKYLSFVAGRYHACGIKLDQTVACFGNNYYSQTSPVSSRKFVELSLGDQHTCGRTVENTVVCWGRNNNGQTSFPSYLDVVQVTAGGFFTCGLLTNNSVPYCIGRSYPGFNYGAIENFPDDSYEMISGGYGTICGILSSEYGLNSTLICSGDNTFGLATPPEGSFIKISVNALHACALTSDGSISCWGDNTFRQSNTASCQCDDHCNQNGLCVGTNVCFCDGHFNATSQCIKCNNGYTGEDCSIPVCFGFIGNDARACSGHGACSANDICNCDTGFFGSRCDQRYQCLWNPNTAGAPTPVVTTQWNNNEITYEVTLTNIPDSSHYITKSNFVSGMFQQYLNLTNYANNSIILDECKKKYIVRVPWSDPSVTQSYNIATETTQLLSKIYISYVNIQDKKIVTFEASQTSYAKMTSDAVSVPVNVTQEEILYYSTNFIYEQSKIIIVGSSIRVITGYTLSSLKMTYSSIGSVFTVTYARSSNNTYDISLYTQAGVTSVTGSYALTAVLSYSGILLNYTIPFNIEYTIIVPSPPANLTFGTQLYLTESTLGAPKTTFEYNERVYVTSALNEYSPKLSTTQKLNLKNAYVCCMKNNAAMPVYNPSQQQYGCTVNNVVTMDRWIQLISNKAPNGLTRLETSISSDRAVFSFDISPLTDKARTCYLHVTSIISSTGARGIRSEAALSDGENAESYSLFTIKKNETSDANTMSRFSFGTIVILIVVCLFQLH